MGILSDECVHPMCRLDGPNVELEAIRALQYEGTPAEVAQGFKEQGNEMTRAKRWKDGKEFYSKGIAALAQGKYSNAAPHAQADERSEPSGDDEKRKEKELEEVCYVNRALCNLELSMPPDNYYRNRAALTTLPYRELQIHNPRLCLRPPPQPPKHQSLLPLFHRPPISRQTPRSRRRLHPQPHHRPHKHRPTNTPPQDPSQR